MMKNDIFSPTFFLSVCGFMLIGFFQNCSNVRLFKQVGSVSLKSAESSGLATTTKCNYSDVTGEIFSVDMQFDLAFPNWQSRGEPNGMEGDPLLCFTSSRNGAFSQPDPGENKWEIKCSEVYFSWYSDSTQKIVVRSPAFRPIWDPVRNTLSISFLGLEYGRRHYRIDFASVDIRGNKHFGSASGVPSCPQNNNNRPVLNPPPKIETPPEINNTPKGTPSVEVPVISNQVDIDVEIDSNTEIETLSPPISAPIPSIAVPPRPAGESEGCNQECDISGMTCGVDESPACNCLAGILFRGCFETPACTPPAVRDGNGNCYIWDGAYH